MATKSASQHHNHWGQFANAASLPGVGSSQDGLEAGDLAYSIADGATFTCTSTAFPSSWSSGGGGGGAASYPDIDQWVTVDKTTGSYTEDGTIQFPEGTVANGIIAAAAMSPSETRRVGIKLMPGHYTEDALDLPSYVYVVGESREACVITRTDDAILLSQTNDHAGYYNVSIKRTGRGGTTNTGEMTITMDGGGWDVDTLDDPAGLFTAGMVGAWIEISGSSIPQNNGLREITAVNSATQIEYDNFLWSPGGRTVTETLTWVLGPTTYAIDIDEAEDIFFRDVEFFFDERAGIEIRGTTDSTVTFERCLMSQTLVLWDEFSALPTFVTNPESGRLSLYGLTISGSGEHSVILDDVAGETLGVECETGYLNVIDTRLQHLVMKGSSWLDMHQSRVVCSQLPGPYMGMENYNPAYLQEDAIRLSTDAFVRIERSTALGFGFEDFQQGGSTIATPVYFSVQPVDLIFSSCRFGIIEGAPFDALEGSILGTANGVFRHCTFDIGVGYGIHDTSTDVKLVGPGEMYNSVNNAMRSAALQAREGFVIKLMADLVTAGGFNTRWPDGYRTTLDLNGFTINSGFLSMDNSFFWYQPTTYSPIAVVKNGRTTGGQLFSVGTDFTSDWKLTMQNVEIEPGGDAIGYFRSGGAGAEVIVDNVRNWNSAGLYALWIGDVNPTVSFRNGSYIKGGPDVGDAAVRFTVANTKFRALRSTFVHGSSGANNPFLSTVSGVVITMDFCRFNSDPTASAAISATAESAYNIFDGSLQDFAG